MTLFTAIRPGPRGIRIQTTIGDEIRLKANLRRPQHPRALSWLLEALALWEGERVRAALCVAGKEGFCIADLLDDFGFGGPLYEIEVVSAAQMQARLRDRVGSGLGSFRELRQLRLFAGGGR